MTSPCEQATVSLRDRLRGHLARYPGLTAFELARVLRGPAGGPSIRAVRTELARMEEDGVTVSAAQQRGHDDPRPCIRWRLA